MKTIKTSLSSRQHSRQINNNKLKKICCLYHEKEFTHMNIWTPLNDFKNRSYHPNTPSIAHRQKKTSSRQIRPMSKGCLFTSTVCFYWRTCSRILEKYVSNVIVLIMPIITLPLVCPGKLLSKWQMWNWTFSMILTNPCSSRKGLGEGWNGSNASGMENYDASKCNRYVIYLDVNNLYWWAMSQPLPTSNFKWLTDKKIEELDVIIVPGDRLRGYIGCGLCMCYFYYLCIYVHFIKCNVSVLSIWEYSHELHDLYKDYLFASERF